MVSPILIPVFEIAYQSIGPVVRIFGGHFPREYTMQRLSLSMAAMALAMAMPVAASAHVSLEKKEAAVGASYKAVFKVPHGCNGSPTNKVSIEIPEGVIGVKPMPKPGWTIAIERGAYKQAYAYYHGSKLSEGVRKVTWSGGLLLDEHYDEFVLSGFIAKELSPGSSISFPVTQHCEQGELNWVEVPGPGQDSHDLKAPAPLLKLVAADGHHSHPATEAKAGDLVIEEPWSRATPAGATVAAGYLKIRNTGAESDTLLGGTATVAERIEVHEVIHKDGIASMRKLAEGLQIPARGSVELKPGGLHLMLIGLKSGLVAGETVKIVLKFKRAGAVAVDFAVAPVGAASANNGHNGHGHHHH